VRESRREVQECDVGVVEDRSEELSRSESGRSVERGKMRTLKSSGRDEGHGEGGVRRLHPTAVRTRLDERRRELRVLTLRQIRSTGALATS
jgi:hypothetical protein